MSPESEQRDIANRLNALCLTVEGGFRDLKKDVSYLGRFYVPLAGLATISLILSVLALVIALENRTLIVSLARETAVEQNRYIPTSPAYSTPSTQHSP